MKMLIAGVSRMSGVGKVSGNAYDMATVIALVLNENFSNAKTRMEGHGYKVSELPLDPAALPQFAALKFPAEYELKTEPRPRNGKFETVCVGVVVKSGA